VLIGSWFFNDFFAFKFGMQVRENEISLLEYSDGDTTHAHVRGNIDCKCFFSENIIQDENFLSSSLGKSLFSVSLVLLLCRHKY